MKRLAVLIGSPSVPGRADFLAGVSMDIENMQRFLKSSIGGSWLDGEIKIFKNNPSYASVLPELKKCELVDFAFVYFSGHGATDIKNDLPRVKFNDYDNPYVRDLANRCKHQITIVDACRGYSEFLNFEGPGLGRIDFPNPNPVFARNVFNQYVENVPDGRVLFFASQQGQNANDTGENGGLFSINLLTSAKDLVYSKNDLVVNVNQVFQLAYEKTRKFHQPDLEILDKDSRKLPFAIKPDYKPTQRNIQSNSTKHNDDIATAIVVSLGAITLGVFIGALLTGRRD